MQIHKIEMQNDFRKVEKWSRKWVWLGKSENGYSVRGKMKKSDVEYFQLENSTEGLKMNKQ